MEELMIQAIEYEKGNPKHIQHLLKVHSFSKLIGIKENIDERTLYILEISAILHDIGIKESYRIYGDSAGHHQEELGPTIALEIMKDYYDKEITDRVCYLIGHHHTYDCIDGIDYQILVEADFLVNMYENNSYYEQCEKVYKNIFKTRTGKYIFKTMFLTSKD